MNTNPDSFAMIPPDVLLAPLSQSENVAALADQVEEDMLAITKLRSDIHLVGATNRHSRLALSQRRVTPHSETPWEALEFRL